MTRYVTPRTPLRRWEAGKREKAAAREAMGKRKEIKGTPAFSLSITLGRSTIYISKEFFGYLHSWEPLLLRSLWLANVSFCFVLIIINNSTL